MSIGAEQLLCKHTIQNIPKNRWGVELPYPPLSGYASVTDSRLNWYIKWIYIVRFARGKPPAVVVS